MTASTSTANCRPTPPARCTLFTQDKVLTEAAKEAAANCTTPALRLPSPAAGEVEMYLMTPGGI